MAAPLQRLAVRAGARASLPALLVPCPASRPALFRPTMPVMTALSLRLATTYRNPNDPASDDLEPAGLPQQRFKNKKVWPPDFSRMTPQEQLRLEKRFKRRMALASARPRWVKFIKLVQLFSITFVVIYCVLFMEWEYGPQPFDGVRAWFWDALGQLKGGQRNALQKPAEGSRADVLPPAKSDK
ncbi:hypothetical protein SCUCBS95973_007546 [Sporothrix curviconia]|uniref:Uncharacterized protein n=1 Tax=Sporothrix curviconia TaxID=1260050 RepID=A0ABP0CGZ5_9PEZI